MKATRVQFPLFDIVSNPTISIANITSRRFNIIDRGWDGGEERLSIIKDFLTYNDAAGRKKYIYEYVRDRKKYDNLRAAIKEICPECEEILNKYLVLK